MNKAEVFHDMIAVMQCNGIRYAVVGNVESYPNEIGSDVDMMIHPSDIEKFHGCIWELVSSDRKVVQMFQHEIVAFYYVMAFKTAQGWDYIQPDVCTDYYRNGLMLLSADEMLSDIRDASDSSGVSKGFKVLGARSEFIYYLLKKIDKRHVSDKQFEHLKSCFVEDPEACKCMMARFWGGDDVASISRQLQTGDNLSFSESIASYRERLHSGRKRRISDLVKNAMLKLRRCLRPTGFTLSVDAALPNRDAICIGVEKALRPAFRRTMIERGCIMNVRLVAAKIRSTLIVGNCFGMSDSRVTDRIGARNAWVIPAGTSVEKSVKIIVDAVLDRLEERLRLRLHE